jgi:hypothetical protein
MPGAGESANQNASTHASDARPHYLKETVRVKQVVRICITMQNPHIWIFGLARRNEIAGWRRGDDVIALK